MNELDEQIKSMRRKYLVFDVLLFVLIAGACGYFGIWSQILALFK
jgi:hypothetical protein